MKKLLTILGLLCLPAITNAEETNIPIEEEPEEIPDYPGKNHHRLPARPINCTISTETGVSIPGVSTSEILSFEIYDESGELCLASFNDEMEFVSFLFSLEGEYVIRFVTENKSYTGYISL